MATPVPEDLVEVFHTDAQFAAQKIVDVVLAPGGVQALIHDRKGQSLPGVGQPGAFFIAVPLSQREQAIGLLDEARQNGFLDETDGSSDGDEGADDGADHAGEEITKA